MNNSTAIIDAYQAIRGGDFEAALAKALEAVANDEEDFWGWFFAACANGFLNQTEDFRTCVQRAGELHKGSPFFHYLKAYVNLLDKDLEKALWEWTRIIDVEEGWLARELIEKARANENLTEQAGAGKFSRFMVLPDFPKLSEPEPRVYEPKTKPKKKRSVPLKLPAAVLALGLVAVVVYFLPGPNPEEDKPSSFEWKTLSIDGGANVLMNRKSDEYLYLYENRDSLVEDFENAKKNLSEKKVNRARFLLQRIILSNADFKSREKSKIFLNFIPEPDYTELNDPVSPRQILEFPEFYTGALVVWEGRVISLKEVDRGKEIRLEIEDEGQTYIVETFFATQTEKNNWQPYEKFQKKEEEIDKQKARAVVYGRFKGLLGRQKNIYLEAIRVWL